MWLNPGDFIGQDTWLTVQRAMVKAMNGHMNAASQVMRFRNRQGRCSRSDSSRLTKKLLNQPCKMAAIVKVELAGPSLSLVVESWQLFSEGP